MQFQFISVSKGIKRLKGLQLVSGEIRGHLRSVSRGIEATHGVFICVAIGL